MDRWNDYMQDMLDLEMDPETGAQPKLRQMFMLGKKLRAVRRFAPPGFASFGGPSSAALFIIKAHNSLVFRKMRSQEYNITIILSVTNGKLLGEDPRGSSDIEDVV